MCNRDGHLLSKWKLESKKYLGIHSLRYHFVGCKTAANAIRLHDEVVAVVAWLFRSLRLDVIVEPTSLFGHNS